MSEKKRCLMIGAGGMASGWIRHFYPRFGDRHEIVALVDVNPDVLNEAGDFLGLPANRRYTDMETAFTEVEADYCTIVIPPAYHKDAVMLAVDKKMDILSEKPIADTWAACIDIYKAVKQAGIKMHVIQNYRYTKRMLTMRQVLRDGTLGRINYIMGRFAADYQAYGAWGAFRHEIPHSLLVEGAVHHFDMLRNLSGGDCRTIGGWEWNTPWSSFRGECCAMYVMDMTNGVKASYEGSGMASATQNTWHREYYRAECEGGAVAIGRDGITRIYRHATGTGIRMEDVKPIVPEYDGHQWLINEFLEWLDGGSAPDTCLNHNIKSVAMVFGAIEASKTSTTVNVEEMVEKICD
ncbi:MAG TPA: Gfo/Idh/MocA family oxidoreductase [candidate division Zixibacteria bacterium]|nr:Gfo/Idh/MocA family oxidoreductase [candidate division Zixibacteria bacterium]